MRRSTILLTAMTLGLSALMPAQAGHAAPKPSLTRHLDMVYVTLLKSATETQIGGTIPLARTIFLTVWLRAVNKNDVQSIIDPADFTIATESGPIRPCGWTVPPQLTGAALDVGQSMAGTVTFMVPAQEHRATLQWGPQPNHEGIHWPMVSWIISY